MDFGATFGEMLKMNADKLRHKPDGFAGIMHSLALLFLRTLDPRLSEQIEAILNEKPEQPLHTKVANFWHKLTPVGTKPQVIPVFVEGVDGTKHEVERLYAREALRMAQLQRLAIQQSPVDLERWKRAFPKLDLNQTVEDMETQFYQTYPEAKLTSVRDNDIIRKHLAQATCLETVAASTTKPNQPTLAIN